MHRRAKFCQNRSIYCGSFFLDFFKWPPSAILDLFEVSRGSTSSLMNVERLRELLDSTDNNLDLLSETGDAIFILTSY